MLARLRGRRAFDAALASVSPLALADSAQRYVAGLDDESLHRCVRRSIDRMDGAERMQFAIALGREFGGDAFGDVAGETISRGELHELAEVSGARLRPSFEAFVRESSRAIWTFDSTALREIVEPLDPVQQPVRSEEPRGASLTLWQNVGIAVAAVIVAFVPLAAQFAHQRGMLQGLSDIAPALPFVHRVAAATVRRAVHHTARTAAPRRMYADTHAAHKSVYHSPRVHRRTYVARAVRHAPVRAHRRSLAWKFDPHNNPYFTHRWRIAARPNPAPAQAPPPRAAAPRSDLEARAALIVRGYLAAVSQGNTQTALAHLGLPAGSDAKNVSEAAFVGRDARVAIVGTKMTAEGAAQVQADINGRSGEYFEVFIVRHDGPAVRIADRYYIPVNRTAEEMAARGLSETHHH